MTIKPAGKGSATVVMSRRDYLVKVMSHLEYENCYQRLDEDPTGRFAEEVTSVLINVTDRKTINKKTFDYLWPQKQRTSPFYILPKIHKYGIQGHAPIVSSCGAPTEKNFPVLYVDFHLKPMVEKIPSYIKHTTNFLFKLNFIDKVPSGSLLVALDVILSIRISLIQKG